MWAHRGADHEFCRGQRPLLPAGLGNVERESLLGHMWTIHLKAKVPTTRLVLAKVPKTHLLADRQLAQSAGVDEPVGELPLNLVHGQPKMTPEQQALRVARYSLQIARNNDEAGRVIRTLAFALGASRTENGTIKALHAILLQLQQPRRLSDREAYKSSGTSLSTFIKWRRRVQSAEL